MAKNKLKRFDVDLDSDNIQEQTEEMLKDELVEDEDENLIDEQDQDIDLGENGQDEDDSSNDNNDEDETAEGSEQDESQDEEQEGDDDSSDDDDEDVKPNTPSNKNSQNQQQKQFGDRANKRIRDLNARTKAAEEFAAKTYQEAEQLRKERYEAEKHRVNTEKELLQLKQEKLQRDYVAASQDGDFEKQAALNSELAGIGVKLVAAEGVAQKYAGDYKPDPRQQNQVQPQVDFDMNEANRLASEWEFDNPRVLSDKTYKDTASKLAEGLMQRGFKPDTEEFYSELSNRMDKAFNGNNAQSVSGKTNKTQVQPKVVAKKVPSAVSGASRTPALQSGNATSSKNNVRLNPSQIAEAKRMGQDLKTYARNMQKIENSIKNKGRVSVDLFED